MPTLWTPYKLPGTASGITPPLLGPDGLMWGMSGTSSPGTGTWLYVTCSSKGVTNSNGGSGTEPELGWTNLITDGQYVYQYSVDGYPHGRMYQVTPGTLGISGPVVNNFPSNYVTGMVMVGGGQAVYVGEGYGGAPAAGFMSPLTTEANNGGPGSGSGSYGYCNFDGARVWAPILGTTSIDAVPITGSGIHAGGYPRYTLPVACRSTYAGPGLPQPQIGFDGTFLYMAAGSGGVIVWNTTTHTGAVFGSTVFGNCYYSANLNRVFMDDAAANVWVMSPGGGAQSVLDNFNGASVSCLGFGDGPQGSVWAAANGQAVIGSGGYYFLVYSENVATMQWVGMV